MKAENCDLLTEFPVRLCSLFIVIGIMKIFIWKLPFNFYIQNKRYFFEIICRINVAGCFLDY